MPGKKNCPPFRYARRICAYPFELGDMIFCKMRNEHVGRAQVRERVISPTVQYKQTGVPP